MSWLTRLFGIRTEQRREQSIATEQARPQASSSGNSALDEALYQASSPEQAEALIKKGANVNAKGGNDWPVIYKCAYLARFAGQRSEANVAYVLLKHGADVNVWTPEGNTPLGVAVMGDDKELVDLFLKHGADVNICKPEDGRTPLHVAAINGNIPLAKLLIDRGAKVDARDAAGKLPVDHAREYNEEATVQFLLSQVDSSTKPIEAAHDAAKRPIEITEEIILGGKCTRCSKPTTRQSLTVYAGNDFYVCPKCVTMFCDQCILTLPLTGSPGYAKCPACDVQLKRAIPGMKT